jgi:hypothetical protein
LNLKTSVTSVTSVTVESLVHLMPLHDVHSRRNRLVRPKASECTHRRVCRSFSCLWLGLLPIAQTAGHHR